MTAIDLLVFPPSLDVISGFFDDGHKQNEDKRCHVCECVAHLQHRDELTHGDDQEEQVVKELELVEQDFRDERDRIVLRVAHLVGHKLEGIGSAIKCHSTFLA